MYDRLQTFTREDLHCIHDASMDILAHTGICFHEADALAVFQQAGFTVEGKRVFMTERSVRDALDTAPSRFTVYARNPANTVAIGEDAYVLLPTCGAPSVVSSTGARREATLQDYHTACQLVQTSDQLDMNGFVMVQPNDLPPQTAHLDMLLANLVLCDKPYLGAATSRQAAIDCLEMAGIAWGGREYLAQRPVMVTNVNIMSPLRYTAEEAACIIEMAACGQPLVITNMVMAGSSGPVSLPSLLALSNAEILGGVVLAQLVRPGSPVIYGSISTPMDMKTIVSAVGAPEAVVLASATIQLAHYYHLPCRTGGMLTNAHCPDAQAAAEGTLLMSTAVRNGANFILHACGQTGSYLSLSFEKWLLDEEVCMMIRKMLTPITVNADTIDVDTIKSVGSDGHYLLHPTTLKQFRNLSQPRFFTRQPHQKWYDLGARRVEEVVADKLSARLTAYTKPPIDTGLEQALEEYVSRQKQALL